MRKKRDMNHKRVSIVMVGLVLLSLVLSGCQSGNPFPLSEPGTYDFGIHLSHDVVDATRVDRKISVQVWYPAVLPDGATPSDGNYDYEPDSSGAPYPLILCSAKAGRTFGPHLASHGFVVAGVNEQDSHNLWGPWLIDYPLDILAALNYIASTPLKDLEGMIDAENAGVMGYSFDGYTSLALSGARVDPGFYLSQCASAATMMPALPAWWISYVRDMTGGWDAFVAHAGPAITTSDDGLWQPMTDERIRAVMPMAPEGAWLFGERGLAAVDRPTLIIGATADEINIYDVEAAYIYEHLGTPDKAMISFVGQGHLMIFNADPVARMKHFAVAFFGEHLQGRANYADYYSKRFVERRANLAWGVYQGE
jgi:predicted dienelactone hydrolase